MSADDLAPARDRRGRIVEVAAQLLQDGGREAVSTRAVALGAGVQAPTLYRLFGDKQGLLDAVAVHGFETYLAEKLDREPSEDPVEDLRRGWDAHLAFGLEHPALHQLMYEQAAGRDAAPAATAAYAQLHRVVDRVAAAGRLRVPAARAIALLTATGGGTTAALIAQPPEVRDLEVSRLAREAVIGAITTEAPVTAAPGPAAAAAALRAMLPDTEVLSPPERALLGEWLDRLANAPG